MKKRVVITGLGVISSVGIGREVFWENIIKGVSGISDVESFDTSNHFTHKGGEIKNFFPEKFIDRRHLKFMSRGTQLSFSSVKLAIEDSLLNKEDLAKFKTALCIGTTLGELPVLERMDREWLKDGPLSVESSLAFQFPTPNMATYAALEYKLHGPIRVFTTACAAGNYSIGFGYDLLQNSEADFVLAGGADAFSWIPFTGFNQFRAIAPEKCQPFDKNRKGLIVGEGSAIVVMETLESALYRNAHIYSEILGYGLSCDAFHVTSTQVDGVYNCMKDAIHQTGILGNSVDYISAHGTGTVQNDKVEMAAIKKLFGDHSQKILISSIKSMIGHTMGAASAIEAIACCLVVQHNIVPPTINWETLDPECDLDCVPNQARKKEVNIALNNGFAFGGNNACLVIKKYRMEGV